MAQRSRANRMNMDYGSKLGQIGSGSEVKNAVIPGKGAHTATQFPLNIKNAVGTKGAKVLPGQYLDVKGAVSKKRYG